MQEKPCAWSLYIRRLSDSLPHEVPLSEMGSGLPWALARPVLEASKDGISRAERAVKSLGLHLRHFGAAMLIGLIISMSVVGNILQ